jgi:hypothetical protein
MDVHNTIIFASFNTQVFQDPELHKLNIDQSDFTFLNMPPASIVFTISKTSVTNDDVIVFTTNGIDGFTSSLSTFRIPKINFLGQKIYFVAKIKSQNGAPRKNYKKLEESPDFLNVNEETPLATRVEDDQITVSEPIITWQLIQSDSTILSARFVIDYGELQNDDGGGYVKGYMQPLEAGNNLRIKILYQDNDTDPVLSLSGVSTPFDVLPARGIYDIRKVGEDHNQTQTFKDLIYQETLLDKTNLFDNFIGQIVGDNKSSPDNLGIKIYEKITNFVSNIADPDIGNLKSLVSQLKQLNIPFEEYNQQFPPSLSRLIDILSVGISRQKGAVNQFQLNFNNKGYTNSNIFGVNRGEILPVATTMLQTGKDSKNIIALEKFSDEYTVVNTNILSAANVEFSVSNTYPLSSYNDTWGWGLVLPSGDYKLENYYEFYDFVDTIEGSFLQKFIDFDNTSNTYLTTLTSADDYAKKWGIADNVISYNLYTNLGLISSS